MNKSIARNRAIQALISKYSKDDKELSSKLFYGYVVDSLKDEFLELYDKFLIETEGQLDTDYDKSLFSSWFYINENKILGEEREGSGYINPVKTVGKIDDINALIPYSVNVNTHSASKTNQPEPKMENEKIEEKVDNPIPTDRKPVSTKKELSIINRIKKGEKEGDENKSDIITIEESLKIYSPSISDDEIKGYVYFKQKFGSPMIGWEKWFLPIEGARGKVCYSTSSFYLKDQQFHDIKLVPTGAILGIKTRFKNEYDNTNYWVIKDDKNELYYASEKNFVEQTSFATVDEKELDKLVRDKGLCYDGEGYVPVFMFTFGDIFDIRDKFRGKYNPETDRFENGIGEEIERKFGKDIYEWHKKLIDDALKSKPSMDFSNTVASERPYLSKENPISSSFMISELDINCGVSIVAHFAELDKSKRYNNRTNYTEEGSKVTLFEAFEIWFGYVVNDTMLEKTSVEDIKQLYFRNGNVFISKEEGVDKEDIEKKKDEKRILAKLEGDKFYSEFLATALSRPDLMVLNSTFNKDYNSFVPLDLARIPVGFEANRNVFNIPDFRLKPVQRNGLAFLNVNHSGCLAHDVGYGKGHLLTSNILTDNGWVKMGDIKVGDSVIGKDGSSTKVLGVYPLGKVQCYKVTFSDGSFTEVSDEHLWSVQTPNYRSKYSHKWDTVLTKDIKDSLYSYAGRYNYSIPMVDPVNFKEQDVPIHPYLLGVLLGDGGLSGDSVCISNTESDIIDRVKAMIPEGLSLKEVLVGKDYRVIGKKGNPNELLDKLRVLGLIGTKSNSKFIPEIYKINSPEVRIQVLRGLLDTDGYITSTKTSKGGCTIVHNTISKQLRDDIIFLVQSFGGTCVVHEKLPTYTHNGEKKTGQLCYNISIRIHGDMCPVSSVKQLKKHKPKSKYQPIRFIQSIEDIGINDAQCIRVEAEDHLYVCDQFIVTHNTAESIHNLAMLLKQGDIKRPLIAVPKQVYKNWIYEMFGYWTNGNERSNTEFKNSYFVNGIFTGLKYKLNEWYNLNEKIGVQNKEIPEYTITLLTYQGLEKIGFSSSLYDELSAEVYQILNQKSGKETTHREEEKKKAKSESKLGAALRKTEYDIDVLGFDYIVLDEAHAFKNVFSSFEIPKEYRNSWRLSNGDASSRGLKVFILCLYIQKKYNGNVNLLTATPFTNSPMELYSMMSLVAYNYLVNSKLNNMFNFLSMFIETQVEYTVDHLQRINLNTVIKSFKNKNILRDLLYRYFDYQDDPKLAGVSRPCKINLPSNAISTFLQMSDLQAQAQEKIEEEADSYDPATNRGAVGRALSWAKSNAFSPYLVPGIPYFENLQEFIDESPKIKFTIECIKTVKDFHESIGQECSGQVIYSNRGVELFGDFKTALEQECGFKQGVKFGDSIVDEVEIMTSAKSDAELDSRDLVKDAFNNGFVKVIIGTSTIQEGMNLQEKSTVLYNLDLDWNPTAFKQLEGRIHRQGNMFKFVRIVVPMIQDTLDSFINQKLDEKSKRIASLWDKGDFVNEISVNDAVDPVELKFNLIKNENTLAAMRLDINIEKAKKELTVNEEKYTSFQLLESAVSDFNDYKERVLPECAETFDNLNDCMLLFNRFVKDNMDTDYQKLNADAINKFRVKIQETIDMYLEFKETGDYASLNSFRRAVTNRSYEGRFKLKNDEHERKISYDYLCDKYKGGGYHSINQIGSWNFDRFMSAFKDSKKQERNLLRPFSLTMFDDFSEIKAKYLDMRDQSKNNFEFVTSPEYRAVVLHEIRVELERRQGDIGELSDRVQAFASQNYLLTYPFVKSESNDCEIPAMPHSESKKYIREELEPSDIQEDEENKADKKVLQRKLKKIQDFFGAAQLSILKSNIEEFSDVLDNLYSIISKMPVTYQTDEIDRDNKIAYLHYFTSSSDWYIVELDKGDAEDEDKNIQSQAFGWAILNGDKEMAELGYISIDEVKKYAELDFYFTPKKLGVIIGTQSDIIEGNDDENDIEDWEDAITTLDMLVSSESGEKSDIDEWKDAIDTLKMLLNK